jgi:HEAT repeat protein
MIRSLLTLALLLPSLALAAAPGTPLPLSPAQRKELAAQIATARERSPRAFEAVDALFAELPKLDAQKRGRILPVGPMLKPLGADAVMPLIHELAFRDRSQSFAELPPSAVKAWRIGALEALGVQRDVRARPVLEAALRAPAGEDPQVVRAAAEALGRLGDDAAVQTLLHLAQPGMPHQAAVLAGMGSCRRSETTGRLMIELMAEKLPEPAQGRALVRALSDAGNAWAWQTPAVRKYATEEREVRSKAAYALIWAYVRYEDDVRQEAFNALRVVDSPDTAAQMAEVRKSAVLLRGLAETPAIYAALDELAKRLESNPAP